MKNVIKIHKLAIACLLTGTMGMTSCSDFLDQEPKSAITKEEALTLENIGPTVDGLYSAFRDSKSGREGLTFSLLGLDESKQGIVQMDDAGQAGLDLYNGQLNPMSTQVDKMWSKRRPMVIAAATAIDALDALDKKAENDDAKARIQQLRAESCFIRALVMMELTMYWGEIPVIDIAKMIDSARHPLNEVWGQIIDDFTFAAKTLKNEYGTTGQMRATSGAAWAMLGKAYMSAPVESGYRDFDLARKSFEEMMDRYSLEPDFAKLFDENLEFNTPESIFELDYNNLVNMNHWQFDMGSRTVDANFGNGCYFTGYDVALPTAYAYKTKAEGGIWEDGDLRKDESIRYDFTYLGVTLTEVSWGADELDPHIKKYEDERTDQFNGSLANMWYSGKNFIFLRYADVLLCYAECLNELGETGQANTIVNQVRTRAWGGTLPNQYAWNYSQEEFRVQILDERIRELCFEGWRRMDLIRTGKFVELIKERNPWAKQSGTIKDFHMRFPIPDTEIKNNSDIPEEDQNPGYK